MEDALDPEVEKAGGEEELPQDPIWAKHADSWQYVTAPLRPCLEDMQMYQERAFERLAGIGMPRVLLLGCTPELLLMEWPPDTKITCIEQSKAMAQKVYEPTRIYVDDYVHTRLKIGNWLRLSEYFSPGEFDLVIGDGCYTQLSAAEYSVLGRQIEAVAAPGCVFLHRFFVVPETWMLSDVLVAPITSNYVLDQLKHPFHCTSFSALKLRLMVSMQDSFHDGVCLGDVYEAWAKFTSQNPMVAVKPQHFLARERDTIEHYRKSKKRYTFPGASLSQMSRVVYPLTLSGLQQPAYPMGSYCRLATLQVQNATQRRPSVLENISHENIE